MFKIEKTRVNTTVITMVLPGMRTIYGVGPSTSVAARDFMCSLVNHLFVEYFDYNWRTPGEYGELNKCLKEAMTAGFEVRIHEQGFSGTKYIDGEEEALQKRLLDKTPIEAIEIVKFAGKAELTARLRDLHTTTPCMFVWFQDPTSGIWFHGEDKRHADLADKLMRDFCVHLVDRMGEIKISSSTKE